MLLSNKYKCPFVVTIHGQDFQYTINKNDKCRKNVYRVLEKSNSVITVSTKLKNVIKEDKIREKIVVINNGINPEEYDKY